MPTLLEDSQAVRSPVARLERRAELDWLRVIGIFWVFLVHTAQVFSPWQVWHIQDAGRAPVFGQINLFAWPWLMPLFMLLAGIGAQMALQRRTTGEYWRDRTLRLVLPFVIGTLILIPPQLYVERIAQGRYNGGYFDFYPQFFDCCYPDGNLAAGHLWFVAYLWVYAIAAIPLFRFLASARGQPVVNALFASFRVRFGIFWPILPFALSQIALRANYPQTLTLIDDWANHAMLFPVYVAGFLLVLDPRMAALVDRAWRGAIILAVPAAAWLAVYVANSRVPGILPLGGTRDYFVFWGLFGVAGWCWLLVLFGFARRFLRRNFAALQYLSRNVYALYMLHQTVIVVIAFVLVQWSLPIAVKFGALLVLAFLTTLGLTSLLAQWRPARLALGLSALRSN
jgi:fucose 4-O-acetylase-like acetyltransferase